MNLTAKARIGVIGLGRIGKIHLENLIEKIEKAEVVAAVTLSESSQQFAKVLGVSEVSSDADIIFSNPTIEGVVICSPTSTHAKFIEKSVQCGKSVFCEKPIDLSLSRVQEVVKSIELNKAEVMIGFNQRFDSDFSKVRDSIASGEVGDLRIIKITSRDPSPPPISYIRTSGGLFHDMTIHDFDMARFLANSEVQEVFATGANLIDPAIGEAGDIDTAIVLLQFENGCKAVIENSREACYGYDQRLEVFGSKGMVQAGNMQKDKVQRFDQEGMHESRLMDFFMDRYEESYRIEMEAFISSIGNNSNALATIYDGLQASAIAEAANLSMELNRSVTIREILVS